MRRASGRSLSRHSGESDLGFQVPHKTVREVYEVENGQVYTETEVIYRKRQYTDWLGDYKTPSIIIKPKPNQNGPRSLFEMAKSKCVRESKGFTTEHFEVVPWAIAKQLWSGIVTTHAETFSTWRNMASVYNDRTEFGQPAYRYHIEIKQPNLSIRDYYKGLTSSNNQWLTALRISPRDLAIPDLVAIANITNLAVLDLSDGQHILEHRPANLDERIMRTWAELAASGRAFQHLQTLMLGWQDGVSDWLFKYLHHFPSLILIVMTDCRNMHQKNRIDWEPSANTFGWEAQHAKKSVKNLRPLLDDETFHVGTISNCYYRGQHSQNEIIFENDEGTTQTRPLVECRLGSPKTWTHIIDEFPGTRTIWLEKSSNDVDVMRTKHVSEPRESMSDLFSSPPPPVRVHNSTIAKRQRTKQSAASLLAEFGI